MTSQNIYDYIKSEEANYLLPTPINDSWEWSMKDHVKLSVLYKNGQFSTGKDENKPFKNITRPILNLQYRAEGFDVKDIVLYVDDSKEYYKSFLVKKFHDDRWVRQNGIDSFIDEVVENYVDFGGCLVKNVNSVRPEVVPLQSIAFCDQTDILSGPIGIRLNYSPDQLKEMEAVGWGNTANGADVTIDELIVLAKDSKRLDANGREIKTPGKYIELFEVHGNMPETFLKEDGDDKKYINQMHIVGFYNREDGQKQGITLFKGKEKKSIFKLVLRDKIYGRALGYGGAEELFEPQVWVNYDIIRIKNMLDAAAKVIYQTSDTAFANRNKISDLDNEEVLVHAEGQPLTQINTTPVNIQLFEKSVAEWEAHAQQLGSANDSIMGVNPNAGTPFALQELVTQESHSLHEYRKGKLASFIEEIYRDWVIPYISKEIAKGTEFLSDLDFEEMQYIADRFVETAAGNLIKEKILNGEAIDPSQVDEYKKAVREDFMKGGSKKFLTILADEMSEANIDIKVNVAGKQKDLASKVQKLGNIFRQVLASPQILQNPAMAKLFNEIIESSGLSPIDFNGFSMPEPTPQTPQMPPQQQMTQQPDQAQQMPQNAMV